jgi:hypothetical protein
MTPQERILLLRERERAVREMEAVRSGKVWPWNVAAVLQPTEAIKAYKETIKTIDKQLANRGKQSAAGTIDEVHEAEPDTSQRMGRNAVEPIKWLRPKKEFEEEFGKLFEQRAIHAANQADAVHKAAQHFVGRDGKCLVPDGSRKRAQRPERILWLKPKVRLGEFLLHLFKQSKILAASELDALRRGAAHFVCQDGKPLNAKSLWAAVAKRKEMREGRRKA